MNIVVIIRSNGERTFEACRGLVLKQFPANAVEVVHERPFEHALRRTYEIGIQRAAKWTMTLDADVLLREGVIFHLIAEADKLPENYFQIEGRAFDKLTGLYRNVGHRIYRTCHLGRAIIHIPADGETMRPEDTVVRRMGGLGFPSRHTGTVVGIHDHEQYFCDIYKKAFNHANKHQHLLTEMASTWKNLAREDSDYLVALKGLCDGLMSLDAVRSDNCSHPKQTESILQQLGLTEKLTLMYSAADSDFVKEILLKGGPAPVLQDYDYAVAISQQKITAQVKIGSKLAERYAQLGLIRLIPFLIGKTFSRVGDMFTKIAVTQQLTDNERD